MKLKLGQIRAISIENLQSLSLVVSSALGGKKQTNMPIQNGAQAVAAFSNVFGNKGSIVKSDKSVFAGLDDTFKKLEAKGS